MSLFKRSIIDSEKELELIATMLDFTTEAINEDSDHISQGGAYDDKFAKKSISKKTAMLSELSDFDLNQYSGLVSKKLLISARNLKEGVMSELSAWIRQDEIAINGGSTYEVEQSIRDARSAQYQLQSSVRTFKSEIPKTAQRYAADHNGLDPDKEIIEYSIRKKS